MTALPGLAATVELHLDALYERDAAGLLLSVRGSAAPPPRIHMVRTGEGNHWLLSAALPPRTRAAVELLLVAEPVADDLNAMERFAPSCRDAMLALLAQEQLPEREYRGPAFTFPGFLGVPSLPVETLGDPTAARPHTSLAWLAGFVDSDRPVVVARDDAGETVVVCHSARLGPASAEAGLEVAEAYRRRGLARAVTLGWARAIQAAGRVPLYSTSWENEASRATARSLGLLPYAEDWHID